MDLPPFLRFAQKFFAGTLLSRVTGALRDMAMAFSFGASPEIASFMVAYRLANLFRRLLGEGNLQAGFVPHYESFFTKGRKEALIFYRDTSFSMLFLLVGAVFLLFLVLAAVRPFLSPSWGEIATLSMWMAPGLIFISLYALNAAFLQAEKSFFTPAVAPVVFNFGWIIAALFASKYPMKSAVKLLSLGIVIAFILQWALTAYFVRKKWRQELSWRQWFSPKLFSQDWRKLIRPLSLGIIGIGATQINTVFDAIFARIADPSGPAFLWYAIRLEQFPLALFGIALSGALLLPLSRAMREENLLEFKELLYQALRYGTTLMVPCTFALFALAVPGINLLFGRGDFSLLDVFKVRLCLFGYAIGLVPSIFTLFFAAGFYAKRKYKVPTIASICCVGFNVLLNTLFIFAFHWGALSVAVATSLASFLNASILAFFLARKIGRVFPKGFAFFFGKLVGACALSWASATGVGSLFYPLSREIGGQLLHFGAASLSFLIVLGASAKVFGLGEVFSTLLQTGAKKKRSAESYSNAS